MPMYPVGVVTSTRLGPSQGQGSGQLPTRAVSRHGAEFSVLVQSLREGPRGLQVWPGPHTSLTLPSDVRIGGMGRSAFSNRTVKAHFLRVGEGEIDDRGDQAEDSPGRMRMRRLPPRVHL
jgi:hypothetical protein